MVNVFARMVALDTEVHVFLAHQILSKEEINVFVIKITIGIREKTLVTS